MLIGVPKEIKIQEYRVGLVPQSVKSFVEQGHEVIVQSGAGQAIGFSDTDYEQAGASIKPEAKDIFDEAEMVVKVKEPSKEECFMLSKGQVLFTYLHLAADKPQALALMQSECTAIAYETIIGEDGKGLPLLQPMSEVAGRLSVQVGAYHLMKHHGGNGRLLGGVSGVNPAKTLIIGGGVSGFNAAQMAAGLQSEVIILDKDEARIEFLKQHFSQDNVEVLYSDADVLEKAIQDTDLLIGAVLIPGAKAPKLITKDMLKLMPAGGVFVDIAIDQGGCAETSRPTSHENPIYEEEGILHYCVTNMPGAVPLTSALALNHSVLPYALDIAQKGWKKALEEKPGFKEGLNVFEGKITCDAVAQALDLTHYPLDEIFV